MENRQIIILGAGIAGIAAAYHFKSAGMDAVIYEKEPHYGGLCASFERNGFRFDHFAHISFDNEPYTYSMLEGRTEHWIRPSEALNYADGRWIRNPVQNNLKNLPLKERLDIIEDYVNRDCGRRTVSYEDWLYRSYGRYFSDCYPKRYTRKYWTVEADMLEPAWVEGRMYVPSLREILTGAMEEGTRPVHYSKEARYPKKGGIQAFLKPMAEECDIVFNKQAVEIDPRARRIVFADGRQTSYEEIISTLPLPEICDMIIDAPPSVKEAGRMLDYTSGAMVSIGFSRPCVSPALWFYIYDEDIWPSRIYSPDWKSPDNVPEGCSSLQAEIYFSKYKPCELLPEELKEKVINQLLKLHLFDKQDIIMQDIRIKKYANIMFTPSIYKNREIIHRYMTKNGIGYAGRFGEWDYLWMGQSFRSGKNAAERIMKNTGRQK